MQIKVTDLQIQFQIGHIYTPFFVGGLDLAVCPVFFFTKRLNTIVHLTISLQPCTNRTACEKKACMTMLIETTSILTVGTIWHATFLVWKVSGQPHSIVCTDHFFDIYLQDGVKFFREKRTETLNRCYL